VCGTRSYADGSPAGPVLVDELPRLAFWLACLFLPLCFSPQCLTDRERDTHLPFTKWDMREHWKARPALSRHRLPAKLALTFTRLRVRWCVVRVPPTSSPIR
jgi:hypothetical protein